MISVIVPSRSRPNELLTGLNSLGLAEHGLEALVWLDADDSQLKQYQKLFESNSYVKLFVKERVGYINFHLMANFLCQQAKYDWILEFNDDAYMDNPNWFTIFTDFVKDFKPAREPVVINIWGQGEIVDNLFPIVSRCYFTILGHFGLTPNCDDWIRLVSIGANISYNLKGIKPKHRKYGGDNPLIDETFREVERDRAENRKRWNEGRRGHVLPQQLLDSDIRKILRYVNERQPSWRFVKI